MCRASLQQQVSQKIADAGKAALAAGAALLLAVSNLSHQTVRAVPHLCAEEASGFVSFVLQQTRILQTSRAGPLSLDCWRSGVFFPRRMNSLDDHAFCTDHVVGAL